MASPWDLWVPGVLSREQLQELCRFGLIKGVTDLEKSFDHSAIDLHITGEAYSLVRGSIKPFGAGYLEYVQAEALVQKVSAEKTGDFLLEPRKTYLFRLQECICGNADGSLWGYATAKSSVGRLDVLVRLIVDGTHRYESFAPKELGDTTKSMFVEVTPITFPVIVREGTSLNQLRLFYGKPSDCELNNSEIAKCCLSAPMSDHHLTVDLSHVELAGATGCGFRAKTPSSSDPIRLFDDERKPDPSKAWEVVAANSKNRINIVKNHFYLLRSKELLRLPSGVAVYARAIDEEIGEMRIHYAGFAHPFFGWMREDGEPGTPLVFEVRCHDVDVSLGHGEVLARLQFFRMSAEAIKRDDDSYQTQTVKLSKYVGKWTSTPNVVLEE